MNRCIKCGQFVAEAERFMNMAGDRLCPRCYDPDLDVDVLTLPTAWIFSDDWLYTWDRAVGSMGQGRKSRPQKDAKAAEKDAKAAKDARKGRTHPVPLKALFNFKDVELRHGSN